uniref:Uncharacterized protein n=1 Tax=Romanomermis culicivorax TaxID=13658 RepID=A0A915KAU6_ROMCU
MAAQRVVRQILDEEEENLPPIRKFKHLINPFDGLSHIDIYNRYRFPAIIILEITDLIKDEIERPSNRSHAIRPLIQVCITLPYLASNSFQQDDGVEEFEDIQGEKYNRFNHKNQITARNSKRAVLFLSRNHCKVIDEILPSNLNVFNVSYMPPLMTYLVALNSFFDQLSESADTYSSQDGT